MKFDYDYAIQAIGPDGFATVEYKCPALGSVTRVFFIPFMESEETIRRIIVERFPVDIFYSRYYTRMKWDSKNASNIRGKMTVDFRDHFYDIQLETVKTLTLNEEKDT